MLAELYVFGPATLLVAWGVFYGTLRHRAQSAAGHLPMQDALDRTRLKLQPDMYCDVALNVLAETDAYALPVAVGRRLLGFFTCTDIFKCNGRDPATTYVGAIMTPPSASDYVRFDDDFEVARKLVARSQFSLLAVVDRKSRLLGFISEDSIARAVRH